MRCEIHQQREPTEQLLGANEAEPRVSIPRWHLGGLNQFLKVNVDQDSKEKLTNEFKTSHQS